LSELCDVTTQKSQSIYEIKLDFILQIAQQIKTYQ